MKKGRKINIILIGRSGSGKGTQAKLLKKHFGNMLHVVTGDLFRELAKKKTDTSKRVAEILKKGGLPHDDLATTLWMYNLAHNLKREEGLICDGFPRRTREAKNLDEFLEFLKRKQDTYVFLIDISEKEAFVRLTKRRIYANRTDDKPDAIKGRMEYFKESVVPTIKYYEKQKRLIKINGEQSIEKVFEDILKTIKSD